MEKGKLIPHNHPSMERELGVPVDHVILDREVYDMLLDSIYKGIETPEISLKRRKQHELKTDPALFEASICFRKPWEIRFNDRDFKVGDRLLLLETRFTGEEMRAGEPLEYTGRKLIREITYILKGYGLQDGWVVMSVV